MKLFDVLKSLGKWETAFMVLGTPVTSGVHSYVSLLDLHTYENFCSILYSLKAQWDKSLVFLLIW